MPKTELDYMENYSSDALAQAAYVTNGDYSTDKIPTMTSNTAPSGVASASSFNAGNDAWEAMRDLNVDPDDTWQSNTGQNFPHWLKYQFTSGKIIRRYTITSRNYSGARACPEDWTLQGSNNDSDWTTLDTQTGQSFTQAEKKTYSFSNLTAYVYYKLNITAGEDSTTVHIGEFELIEITLQCGSESTIKTQGSYALKGIATTDAINDTLTRTVSPTINLSGISRIKFGIRASRTGSNIKIGFHDSGGTTTEVTPNIASANTFQTVTLNMSAVSNANKDVINSIIITILNADAANTFYIDNMYAETISGAVFFGCNF